MTALDVQCILCGAKPGWHCIGAPNSGRAGQRVPPHRMRVEDALALERLDDAVKAVDAVASAVDDALELTPTEMWKEHMAMGYGA